MEKVRRYLGQGLRKVPIKGGKGRGGLRGGVLLKGGGGLREKERRRRKFEDLK